MRLAVAPTPWILLLVLATAGFAWGIDAPTRPAALNLASLFGMLLLAIPAIRVNEQGRLIATVQSLQKGIEALRVALQEKTLSEERRAIHEASLAERTELLAGELSNLSSGKGAWTRPVHYTLYGGYVLLLATALARTLI
ncbi:MAG: hypothetical protein ACE5DS_09990 [Kiloniellaceae bacterium]